MTGNGLPVEVYLLNLRDRFGSRPCKNVFKILQVELAIKISPNLFYFVYFLCQNNSIQLLFMENILMEVQLFCVFTQPRSKLDLRRLNWLVTK